MSCFCHQPTNSTQRTWKFTPAFKGDSGLRWSKSHSKLKTIEIRDSESRSLFRCNFWYDYWHKLCTAGQVFGPVVKILWEHLHPTMACPLLGFQRCSCTPREAGSDSLISCIPATPLGDPDSHSSLLFAGIWGVKQQMQTSVLKSYLQNFRIKWGFKAWLENAAVRQMWTQVYFWRGKFKAFKQRMFG